LKTIGRQIDDRKPPVRESDQAIRSLVGALAIGPTMSLSQAHGAKGTGGIRA
jgi:hypothetical protein